MSLVATPIGPQPNMGDELYFGEGEGGRGYSAYKIVLYPKRLMWAEPMKPWGIHPPWTHYVAEDYTYGAAFRQIEELGHELYYNPYPVDGFFISPGEGTVFLDEAAMVLLTLLV